MNTIINNLNIELRNQYLLPTNKFQPNTKITILEHDSYNNLLALLTPEQREKMMELAKNGEFIGINGYVTEKM